MKTTKYFKFFIVVTLFVISLASIACTWDSDCPDGYQCVENNCRMGKWPDGGCTWDSDCLDGYYCDNGECRMGKWPDGGCTWDSDCLDGYYCDNGDCRMGKWPDGGCTWDSDCLDGYKCENNECVYEGDNAPVNQRNKADSLSQMLKVIGLKQDTKNCDRTR